MNTRVRFEDNLHLSFPTTRWSLSHLRELVPTAAVRCGSRSARPLGTPASAGELQIDALQFRDLNGQPRTWAAALMDTYTDGVLVLHRGVPVYERYFGECMPQRPHACFSITKSYAATLAAVLIHENILDAAKPVSHYLPEMAGTAFADATLRQVLDMQVGVEYSENYADSASPFWSYTRAAGLRPAVSNRAGPRTNREFLMAVGKRGTHGVAFDYATIDTEVLCWIVTRATGTTLAEYLSGRIWSQIGCEEDGYLTVDADGIEMGGAGLCATLRDVARFGELMRCEGACAGRQIIPEAVVADIRRGSDTAKFALAGYSLLPGYSYRNMWWVSHNSRGVFEGRGIFGQRLYIAPKAELVIVRFASHPIAASAANDPITLPSFDAVCALLAR